MAKHTKRTAGALGGKSTLAHYGTLHFAKIGKRGAAVTWQRYVLKPIGTFEFAMVDRKTGAVKALLSGEIFNA